MIKKLIFAMLMIPSLSYGDLWWVSSSELIQKDIKTIEAKPPV